MIGKIKNVMLTIVGVVFLIWFSAPMCWRVINPGNLLGILICMYLIFRFGFKKGYDRLKDCFNRKKPLKVLWVIHNVLVSAFAIYAVVISGFMVYFATIQPEQGSTAIVLGAQVRNGYASAPLMQRIKAGKDYLENNPDAVAVVTGGQGDDESVSEAKCMYDNLVIMGIEPDRIYLEDKATNTLENMEFSYDIINDKGLSKSLAIVTDSYHQLRARIIAYKQGIDTPIGAVNSKNDKIGFFNYPTFFVREWIAIPFSYLR